MKIRINDRPDIQEIEVIINCVADDPLVNKIISALNTVDAKLLCRRQGETFQLGLADILYIESVDRKTFLYTEEQVYETDRRLYELEDYLKDHSFFRTSKTTIINLLMRFYDVDSGEIRVDGADIRDMTRHDLRGRYGMVLQDTWLCTGTVRENIAYGKPDATEEEVIEAAKAAHADSFIRRLPKGYDTMITGGGGNLSAGQRQLLCIARAMLCLPMMLILDEATSSIDTRTEMKIQSAFAKMMKGRTSFIVAHRLSTNREADVILVMKDGSIIEQGNHKELLAAGGFYANLYNSQFVTAQS